MHAEELAARAASLPKEETQYFSQPEEEAQRSAGLAEGQPTDSSRSQPEEGAPVGREPGPTTAALPPVPAGAACTVALAHAAIAAAPSEAGGEGFQAAVVGRGEDSAGVPVAPVIHGGPIEQEQRRETPSKRSPAGGGEHAGQAKRAKQRAGPHPGDEASAGVGARTQPLGWLRGVEDSDWQSPSGSVTSSALAGLYRWRGQQAQQAAAGKARQEETNARRLSLPSAHSSPAKRAPQQAQQAQRPLEGRAGQQEDQKENQQPAAPEGQVTQQAQQPAFESQGCQTALPARQPWGKPGASQDALAGPQPPTHANSPGAGGHREGVALELVTAQQASQAQQGQQAQQELRDVPGQHQRPPAPVLPSSPPAAAAVALGGSRGGAEPAVASPTLALSPVAGLSPVEALSPGLLGRRLDSFVQGLDAVQATPAPAQLPAFQTTRVPGPSDGIPPAADIAAGTAVAAAQARLQSVSPGDGGAAPAPLVASSTVLGNCKKASKGLRQGRMHIGVGTAAANKGAVPAGPGVEAQHDSAAGTMADDGRQYDSVSTAPLQHKTARHSAGEPFLRTGRRAPLPTALPGAAETPTAAAAAAAVAATAAAAPSPTLPTIAPASGRRVPSRLVQWACEACTFLNEPQKRKCAMCSTPKPPPGKAASPAAACAAALTSPLLPEQAQQQARQQEVPVGGGCPIHGKCSGKARRASAPAGEAAVERRQGAEGKEGRNSKRRRVSAAPGSRAAADVVNAAAPAEEPGTVTGKGGDTPAAAQAPARDQTRPGPPATVAQQEQQAREPPSAPPSAAPTRSRRRSATPAVVGSAGKAEAPAPWRGPRCSAWLLLGSGLSARGKELLAQVAAASGAGVSSKWGPRVTHVICGTVDGAARRTYKYLMAVLSSKRVMTEGWLEACLAGGQAVDEELYEVARDVNGAEGGPAASRHSRALGLPPLLQDYEIFLAGSYTNKQDIAELLRAAGARVLSRPPSVQARAGTAGAVPPGPCTSFVLCEASEGGSPQQAQQSQQGSAHGRPPRQGAVAALQQEKWYSRAAAAGVSIVSSKWLMDTVSSYTLKPLQDYLV
ncbi:hypothetical protein N2152v2_001548 [Parachlorella kessleri]